MSLCFLGLCEFILSPTANLANSQIFFLHSTSISVSMVISVRFSPTFKCSAINKLLTEQQNLVLHKYLLVPPLNFIATVLPFLCHDHPRSERSSPSGWELPLLSLLHTQLQSKALNFNSAHSSIRFLSFFRPDCPSHFTVL
jgi:hypothetical protein